MYTLHAACLQLPYEAYEAFTVDVCSCANVFALNLSEQLCVNHIMIIFS